MRYIFEIDPIGNNEVINWLSTHVYLIRSWIMEFMLVI